MEALAILNSHDHTIRSIHNLIKWLEKASRSDTDLHQLLYDGHRFAQYFANTIKEHPLLIYTTALPFTPTNTSIFKIFHRSDLPKVVCGVDKMWSPELMRFQGHDYSIRSLAFSPGGSKIISGSEDKTVQVWDTSSGIEILPPLQGHDGCISSVASSPDGSKIISGSEDGIGMQALASRYSHPFKAIMTCVPSHSHLMDPKSSQSHCSGSFNFWMQALGSVCYRIHK
ncbi:hypothetical protein AX14_002344 [Amanita brunnescens Koide BX004]|nr:hypothetical protein AX14_002344 [Amanita brunnescens Koide BX004]